MATPIEFAIVAALDREVGPLLRRAERIRTVGDFVYYELHSAVIVCGGIGQAAARRAAEALIAEYLPGTIISTGFAGALQPQLKVGHVFIPAEILDVAGGRRFQTASGTGLLATVNGIAGEKKKRELQTTSAAAVDMEAAAIAEVAQQQRVKFLAIKAISDDLQFPMPAMERFVNGAGKFRTASFITHVALRPAMWRHVLHLARNSARAAKALSTALDTLLTDGFVPKTHIGDMVREGSV
jgi:adenosylhomocysteine nucleosidase